MGYINTQAQDITDAFRYGNTELKGSARFQAMSGAFGALGGDISAIPHNPASSSVLLNSAASISFSNLSTENTTQYYNGNTERSDDDFNLNQAGAVFVFNSSNSNNDWNKFSFGINYAKTSSYDDEFLANGNSPNSIDQYFLSYAQGVPLDLLKTREGETIPDLYQYLGENESFGAQQAFLGYQGYIIEPVNDVENNTDYFSLIAGDNFSQDYTYLSSGINGTLSFNFSAEFQKKLYLGVNLNSHIINFDKTTTLYERNIDPNSDTNEILFENNLSTDGDGISAQIGGIYKINELFRIGATYETPTWYTIEEENSQYLRTYGEQANETININPRVVNVYPEYDLRTPGKITVSAATVLGKSGLISFDYSYKDFGNTEFDAGSSSYFNTQNDIISQELTAVSTYRIGGEYRIKSLSLRAGYRYQDSPYKNESTYSDINSYSAGIGYSFGALKLDVAYVNTKYSENKKLYQVGLTDTAAIDRDNSSLVFSLTFGL